MRRSHVRKVAAPNKRVTDVSVDRTLGDQREQGIDIAIEHAGDDVGEAFGDGVAKQNVKFLKKGTTLCGCADEKRIDRACRFERPEYGDGPCQDEVVTHVLGTLRYLCVRAGQL